MGLLTDVPFGFAGRSIVIVGLLTSVISSGFTVMDQTERVQCSPFNSATGKPFALECHDDQTVAAACRRRHFKPALEPLPFEK